MCFKNLRDHSAPLFARLYRIYKAFISTCLPYLFTYKSLKKNNSIFVPYKGNYNTRLANMFTLAVPDIPTTHSRQSVRWVGTQVWNSLPLEFRDPQLEYNLFKIRLKRYLMSLQ